VLAALAFVFGSCVEFFRAIPPHTRTSVIIARKMGKAPLCLMRCDIACGPPVQLSHARVSAPVIGTREVKLLWTQLTSAQKARAAAVYGLGTSPDGMDPFHPVPPPADTTDGTPCKAATLIPASFPPRSVLIIKKWHDQEATDAALEVATWLRRTYGVWVRIAMTESQERVEEERGGELPTGSPGGSVSPDDNLWYPPADSTGGDDIDVVITIGGDGTVLFASSLFQGPMPPVLAIAFGSLGFMTVHSLSSCVPTLHKIFDPTPYGLRQSISTPKGDDTLPLTYLTSLEPIPTPTSNAFIGDGASPTPQPINVSLRMRLTVDVYRKGSVPGKDAPAVTRVVLNELLLERGPSPYMASLNAYVDDEPLTTVNADGLIIATQTGSTAYALSAGSSILSPNTAAMCFVPICPHTLSFRPLLFPDSAVIRLEVPLDARSDAHCAFDGRDSMPLYKGDFVVVRSSMWPLPLLCRTTACGDWIRAIKCKLYWNVRIK
jgi:NAD+ kinase